MSREIERENSLGITMKVQYTIRSCYLERMYAYMFNAYGHFSQNLYNYSELPTSFFSNFLYESYGMTIKVKTISSAELEINHIWANILL